MSELVDRGGIRGFLHRPDGDIVGGVVFAHGAGGNSDSLLLRALAAGLAAEGFLVLRFDLPYRQRRPSGPPHPSKAAEDRAGIEAAIAEMRAFVPGSPVIAGGQSYGGRQTSMLLAEQPDLADGLLLTSYPLHPPGKPEKARTEHLPQLRTPTVVVHGSKDTFATTAEITAALDLIPAPTTLVEIDGGRHDLSPEKFPVVARTVEAVLRELPTGDR
ncbi:hypothetical protein SAMN05444695_104153 [Rhodococcus triatomae]|uniref:KANL3/Tex30 alpha/beta hydrolase-like domain-containing protein n=1 Tax=Rhodococcus triatomae TaxID=300028 RepID=A0A1G8GN60_9NOCA|nr:alpha/beta fold hydrolase [Rhodococcus triatomae]SDH95793.1 hypothetical protein SAMN05444695_104153 [Rhodococcus triatomae]